MAHSKEPGTLLPHEVDELAHYIFHNYLALMTLAEKAAYKALMLEWMGAIMITSGVEIDCG